MRRYPLEAHLSHVLGNQDAKVEFRLICLLVATPHVTEDDGARYILIKSEKIGVSRWIHLPNVQRCIVYLFACNKKGHPPPDPLGLLVLFQESRRADSNR